MKVNDQKNNNTVYSVALLTGTVYWLVSHFINYDNYGTLFMESASVFIFCFTVENVVSVAFPSCLKPAVLTHFTLGWMQQFSYLLAACTDLQIFERIWRPLYFGYYMWTIIYILVKPQIFFPAFQHFYSVHHIISFFITGSWTFFPGDWSEAYILRGLALWLVSDIFVYTINIYKAIDPKGVDKDFYKKLQLGVFCLERVQRIASYLQIFVPYQQGVSPSPLAFAIMGTGLFNDIVDAKFQFQSIRANFKKKGRKRLSIYD